jgi:hypothetical protein
VIEGRRRGERRLKKLFLKESENTLSGKRKRGPLMVAQWLRYCPTNWKVDSSIPDGVIGIFH